MQQSRMKWPHALGSCHFAPIPSYGHQRRPEMPRFGYLKTTLFSLVCLLLLASGSNAQSPAQTPELSLKDLAVPAPRAIVGESTMYCAGNIRYQKLQHMPEIVGAE